MTINLNDIINYGGAKFKIVKTATSNDIETLNNKINLIDKNRKNSTNYSLNDVAFSASLPSSLVLECTTAGITAVTEPDFTGAVKDDTITDGTVVWTYRSILSGGGSTAPTIDIGTVTTGAAGSNASASITDNGNNNYSLNLTIPKGDTGAAGSNGSAPVVSSTITVSSLAAGSNATANWSGAGTSTNPLLLSLGIPRGSNGTNGTNGTTPTFSSTCTVSTLSAGSSATASVSGSGTSSSPYKFSFGIPKGATGSTGPTGPSAISAATLSTNGYIKLSNGLIIQWGMHTATSGTNITTITYPIQFPSSVYIVGPMSYQNAGFCMTYGSVTTTSCQISSFKFANSVISGSNISFVWIAIGK